MKLTKTQYDTIMNEYRDRRQERDELIRARKRELECKVPGFAALDDAFVEQGRQAMMEHLSHPDSDAPDYEALAKRTVSQEHDLMRQSGYPEDYLDPPYHCPDCHDTGYIGEDTCHCFRKRAIELIFHDEPVMKRLLTDRFEDFDVDAYPRDRMDSQSGVSAREWAETALEESQKFVDNFDKGSRNIVFYGTPGSGKTFLSSCIAGDLLRSGRTVLYLSASRLFDVMADHSFGRTKDSDDIGYSSIFAADLLIIDDLGTELTNAFTASALFDVIGSRGSNDRSVIISTNLGLNEIRERYTERIYSRLIEKYNFYHLFGFDGRYENGLKQQDPAKNGGN